MSVVVVPFALAVENTISLQNSTPPILCRKSLRVKDICYPTCPSLSDPRKSIVTLPVLLWRVRFLPYQTYGLAGEQGNYTPRRFYRYRSSRKQRHSQ